MTTLSTAIAAWTAELDPARIPPEVATAAKLRVLDIVGAMLGGRETELAEQTARAVFVPENGSGSPVIGFAGQTGVGSAALLRVSMPVRPSLPQLSPRRGNCVPPALR
jgi:2-methylcitrate dehydratase PrpD